MGANDFGQDLDANIVPVLNIHQALAYDKSHWNVAGNFFIFVC